MPATRYERATAPIGDSDANRALREDGYRPYASANGKNYYQRVARQRVARQREGASPAREATSEGGAIASDEGAFRALLNEPIMGALIDAGYSTLDALREASDEDLLAIDGIGPATLKKIRSATS